MKHSLVLVVFAHAVVAMIEIVSIELVLRTATIAYGQNLAGEAGLVGIFHLHALGILLVPHHFAIGLEATFASRLLEVAGRAFEEQAIVVHHEVVLMIRISVVAVANVVGLHGKAFLGILCLEFCHCLGEVVLLLILPNLLEIELDVRFVGFGHRREVVEHVGK